MFENLLSLLLIGEGIFWLCFNLVMYLNSQTDNRQTCQV